MSGDGGRLAVGVFGAAGRMGAMVCEAVADAPDLELVARAGRADPRDPLGRAAVLVDFTHPEAVMANIRWCLDNRRHVVVGTSGMDEHRLATVRGWLADAPGVGVVVVPNFSISAALAMSFAVRAAEYFGSVEIVDYAHATKLDAPSGTAVRTAELITAAGYDVDGIHSVRMPGFASHQTVRLGRDGEVVSIRFDTTDRRAFLPGILAAIRAAPRRPGLAVGLESLIDLGAT
jgi:4-hydroxy-tetrahydrodipicolinate reductase